MAAAGAGGGEGATSSPGLGSPLSPGQSLLSGGALSLPRAGLPVRGGAPSYPTGFLRRGLGKLGCWDRPSSPSCPQEHSLAELETLVQKLHVTEEEEGKPPRQPCKADRAPPRAGLGSGEPLGGRRWTPMDPVPEMPQDWVDLVHCAISEMQRETESSSPGEQQGWPSLTSMILQLWRRDQDLVHAGRCRQVGCLQPSCQDVRRLVRHIQACKCGNLDLCLLCDQLVTLCYGHAQHCPDELCPAPFCLAIKPHLYKISLWLRPAREKNGKMTAMSAARAQRAARAVGLASWPGGANDPAMSRMKLRTCRMPAGQMGRGLNLPGLAPLMCNSSWRVMSFLKDTVKSYRPPQKIGAGVPAHGQTASGDCVQSQPCDSLGYYHCCRRDRPQASAPRPQLSCRAMFDAQQRPLR